MRNTTAPNSLAGKYVDNDDTTATVGTTGIAFDKNAIQEELVNAIEGAGLTQDGGNNAQLLQAIQTLISAGGSTTGYNAETIINLSGSGSVEDLDAFFAQSDGWTESWAFFGGSGPNKLTFSGGTGKTIGGVAVASILSDIVGDGQGRLTLRKDGDNARIVYFEDSDGGQFTDGEFKKCASGSIEQCAQVSNSVAISTSSGSLYRTFAYNAQLPISQKTGANFFASVGNTPADYYWIVIMEDAYTDTIETPYYYYVSSTLRSAEQKEINITSCGTWTNEYPQIG